jgi:hypothetical protein
MTPPALAPLVSITIPRTVPFSKNRPVSALIPKLVTPSFGGEAEQRQHYMPISMTRGSTRKNWA